MRHISLPEGVTMDAIEWRLCHATSDYEISEYGHVRRRTPGRKTWPGKILSHRLHHHGYPRYSLTIGGMVRDFECHRLVAGAFLPSPGPEQVEVAHEDGDPKNNHYSNLTWKTHKENEADKFRHGTDSRGVRNSQSKMNEELVRLIRNKYASGLSLTTLGREFGVAFQTISKIVNRRSWSHVQ